jgi:hypothetical protein
MTGIPPSADPATGDWEGEISRALFLQPKAGAQPVLRPLYPGI